MLHRRGSRRSTRFPSRPRATRSCWRFPEPCCKAIRRRPAAPRTTPRRIFRWSNCAGSTAARSSARSPTSSHRTPISPRRSGRSRSVRIWCPNRGFESRSPLRTPDTDRPFGALAVGPYLVSVTVNGIRSLDSVTGVGTPSISLNPAGTLPTATANVPYSATLQATGGSPPYRFSVVSGNLPQGLSLSSGGVISGSAQAGGSYAFTVNAIDSSSAQVGGPFNGWQAYVLPVDAEADQSISVSGSASSVAAGTTITYLIKAANAGPSNAVGSTVIDSFPAGLTCAWTCVGAQGGVCSASGNGRVNDAVTLPVGASVTYTARCSVDPALSGDL